MIQINDWALASQSPIVDRAIPILEHVVDRETSILGQDLSDFHQERKCLFFSFP